MSSPQSGSRAKRGVPAQSIAVATAVLVLVGILIAVGLASRGTVAPSAAAAPANAVLTLGQTAPPFTLSTTGGPFDSTQLQGKPMLLEVFATWCPHCQRETAVLNRLYAKFGSRVNFVSVSGSVYAMDSQTPETQADVIAFAQRFGVRYPIAFDPKLAVADAYLQGGFPTFVAIDKNDRIRAFDTGEVAESQLTAYIQGALAEKNVKK